MSALAFARTQWRRLPLSWRRVLGGRLLQLAEPSLAGLLPRADPKAAGRPQESAELYGLFGAALGHASAAALLRAELLAAGVRTTRRDLTRLAGAEANAEALDLAEDAPRDQEAAAILVANPDTLIVSLAGGMHRELAGRRVIGYWVWELEQAPARWAHAAHAVHEIWSPSAFSARAIEATLGRPARVVPHPVALAPPPLPTVETRAAARSRFGAGPATFVAVSSFTATSSLARKNPFAAIRAFADAFSPEQDALLILRCLGAGRFPGAVETLRQAVRASPARILLLDRPGGLEELHALYAAADVYLSLHRSEGFGLNLAEAMLSRRAVLATAYSGPLEFLGAASAALVPARMVPVVDPQGVYRLRGACWAEPDHDAAVALLRGLAQDASLRERLAQAGLHQARLALSGGAAAQALRRPDGAGTA